MSHFHHERGTAPRLNEASCQNFRLSKRTYRSKAAAEKARIKIASRGAGRFKSKTRLWPFECRFCGQWHLTSIPQDRKAA